MYTYNIQVVKVIDGDTIDANIDLGFDISVKKNKIHGDKYTRITY